MPDSVPLHLILRLPKDTFKLIKTCTRKAVNPIGQGGESEWSTSWTISAGTSTPTRALLYYCFVFIDNFHEGGSLLRPGGSQVSTGTHL